MTPRIGILMPTSRDLAYNHRSWPMYAAAVQRSGGEPVRLELGAPSTLRAASEGCDGFILPGSPADVQPSRYGQEVDPLTSPADLPREACDDLLLDVAAKAGKPILGICFGLQSLNVWKGGSLLQHVLPLPVHHAAGPEVAIAHTVLVAKGSLLGSLIDPGEAKEEGAFLRLPINTSHHQAVAAPGAGLSVVARSPDDGVIEALEASPADAGPFLLGVQWHPERSFEISATSRALFARLVAESIGWASAHTALVAR